MTRIIVKNPIRRVASHNPLTHKSGHAPGTEASLLYKGFINADLAEERLRLLFVGEHCYHLAKHVFKRRVLRLETSESYPCLTGIVVR
ncbi:MAG: hypothetical protein RLZZ387_5506, partial [Chloroflexota bacterium]